ncbi:MAG: transpeptidase family protein [Bacteroidales bacterium]|nr:transpeptidase family protein [Bacteroidales bacterium]
MSTSIKSDIVWRVGLVYLAMALFGGLIIVKIIYLQLIDDDKWKKVAEKTQIQDAKIEPLRGDIYSDDMRLLASSVPMYQIRMDPLTKEMSDEIFKNNVGSLAASMANLFRDRTEAQYRAILEDAREKGNKYVKLKDDVSYEQLKKVREFPVFKLSAFRYGLIEVPVNEREYPFKKLAHRTIGYTVNDVSKIRVGLEGGFNKYLRGIEGAQKMQRLYGGDLMPVKEAGQIEPRDGSSVVSTINIDMQDIAYEALKRQVELHEASAGTVVLMEVGTGDVKAIVNLTYDTVSHEYEEIRNYAVGVSSEPGSTFKLPAIMVAMEDGYVVPTREVETGNGIYKYNTREITDHKDGGFGKITAREVIEQSSNIGMVKLITEAYASQPEKFFNGLYKMNLNLPLGLPINGEGEPVFHYPGAEGEDAWNPSTLASMAYGYALELTPLQTLTFFNAVANNGRMVKPRFATEVKFRGKTEKTFPVEVINPSICSHATLVAAREMLEGVVEEGTVKYQKSKLVRAAGKTGTNRMYIPGKGYDKAKHQTSFVGYFPAEKPKFSCIVIVYSPKGSNRSGSNVAAPAFFEIAEKVYLKDVSMQKALNSQKPENLEIPYSKKGYQSDIEMVLSQLQISRKSSAEPANWVRTEKRDDHIELIPVELQDGLVPDVVSMGLSDAVYLLENLGLKVQVEGRGSIKSQSIPPGTKAVRGEVIKLEMRYTEG